MRKVLGVVAIVVAVVSLSACAITRTCESLEPGYSTCVTVIVEPAVACEGSCKN